MIALELYQLCLVAFPLLLIEGFFSGSEIALLSADKLILKHQKQQGDQSAALALSLANTPERILSTTLLMTNLCVVANSSLVVLFCLQKGFRNPDIMAITITTPWVVLVGELIPKTLYRKNATELARYVARPVYWTYCIFFPITRLLAYYTNQISRMMSPIQVLFAGKQKTVRDEIRSLLSYHKKETEITTVERQIIQRIFDFKDIEVKKALIPLVRVHAISEVATVQEALERFGRYRHSRMPVFSERVDNIIGTLDIADLLAATDFRQPVQHYVTPACYVSETQSLAELLIEIRRDRKKMVVAVDEHGGAVGILTFEDIVEEIVGEIRDEYDLDPLSYKILAEDTWSVQARMEIPQINEVLKLGIPMGNYETLSGFLLQQFARIPEVRDVLYFNTSTGNYCFTIQKATDRHIETVLVQKLVKD